jgi:hypothetical protein
MLLVLSSITTKITVDMNLLFYVTKKNKDKNGKNNSASRQIIIPL